MTSCATPQVQTVTKIEYAVPSSVLLTPCPPLLFDIQTNGDLIMAIIDLNAQYKICAARMDAVIEYFDGIEGAK